MFKQEKQLRVLAKWLKESDDIYMMRDGMMEQQINSALKECMFKIGDYLEEILNMDDEQLIKEQKLWEVTQQQATCNLR